MKTINIFLLFVLCLVINSYTLKNEPVQDLTNTSWTISYYSQEYGNRVFTIHFNENKKLTSTHPNDNTTDNDFWKQKGQNIAFDFNDKYVVYKGKLVSATKMKGHAKNKVNKEWDWVATKKE